MNIVAITPPTFASAVAVALCVFAVVFCALLRAWFFHSIRNGAKFGRARTIHLTLFTTTLAMTVASVAVVCVLSDWLVYDFLKIG